MTSHHADELKAFYRRYIDRCNAHRFEDLSEFVAEDVEVNGYPQGLGGYIGELRARRVPYGTAGAPWLAEVINRRTAMSEDPQDQA